VSSTCLVAVARNRYSVPREWATQRVTEAMSMFIKAAALVLTNDNSRSGDRLQ
jgi:hypothetical protein